MVTQEEVKDSPNGSDEDNVVADDLTTEESTSSRISAEKVFTLYPNPTNGILTIEGLSEDIQIYLHDLLGKEVVATYSSEISFFMGWGGTPPFPRSTTPTHSLHQIDLSDLPSGVYILSWRGEKSKGTEVIVKE